MVPTYSFDVATVPAGLSVDGSRDLSGARWSRVVVLADRLVEAHLLAAQFAGVHGMVIDVLYRE